MPAKVRFHKALTRELRRILKAQGIFIDEETAHYVLGGLKPLQAHYPAQILDTAQTEVHERPARKRRLQQDWEEQFPSLNPFPPPFPQTVLDMVHRGLRELGPEAEGPALEVLQAIELRCITELTFEP